MGSKQVSRMPGGAADEDATTVNLERLRGANVLVTGGAGFIGSHLVDQLIDAGAVSVVVLDNLVRGRVSNLQAALRSNRVRLLTGDIRDRHLIDESVRGADYVFHMAALRITHCAAEPRLAMEVMVDATYDLFEACRSAGVKKVVFSSSASVYGMADSFPTTEAHHPYGNRTLYGAAKSFGESLLRSLNDMYGTNYVCLRYFNVYGPRMDIHGRYTEVLSRWMERLEDGQAPIIFGDGSQTMDMVHVRDIARANVLAAVSDASDIALNVGSGTETSLLGLAHTLARIMDRGKLQPIFQEARSINPVARRLADVSLARNAIGFESQISFEAGLRELVEWWRAERNRPESSRAAG
jgi:UDP-glucose 4-epimerase